MRKCAGSPGLEIYRTPDERFEDLPDFPFTPRYLEVPAEPGAGNQVLRLHYVDEGSPGAPPILMLHGEPTWSFLYRKMIPPLAAAGHRVIALDHVGFGRSDKPVDRFVYSFEAHVDWVHAFVEGLELSEITLVGQDWGGPIGLAVLSKVPHRFAGVVAANTILHTAEPDLAGRLAWANHGVGESEVRVAEGLLDWMTFSQRSPVMEASLAVGGSTTKNVEAEVLAAYDAPFPEERAKAGMRQFPILIPVTRNDAGSAINQATWKSLSRFEKPFLTLFSDTDPATAGWQTIFQERVPGAGGQPHAVLRGAGHFLQEDVGEDLALRITDWMSKVGATSG